MSRYSLFLIFIFLFGLFFCLTQTQLVTCQKEPFTDNSNESEDLCPNLLIKKGSKYYLQNTKKLLYQV